MERLTYWESKDKGFALPVTINEDGDTVDLETLCACLATYEDTGLTPEEITGLCEMDKRSKMGKMLRWEEADSEERLFVLPCKIGTHLWRVTYPYRQEPKVTEYVVKNFRTAGKKHALQLEVQALSVPVTNWMYYDDFFETYEEAQERLKKVDEICNGF